MRNALSFVTIGFLVCLSLLACAPKTTQPPSAMPDGVLAVAGFSQPTQNWEYLSSFRPQAQPRLDPGVMAELDDMLHQTLKDEPGRIMLGPDVTRQCQELVLSATKGEGQGMAGLRYWLDVARCVPADYLLVPQILEWRERVGGEWGVNEPAKVTFELTLLDVAQQRVTQRYHFEESQVSLSEDLLKAKTFFRRGGKWLTTRQLMQDGLREGLQELGL